MFSPLEWPHEATARSGNACSRAMRTASVIDSDGVVVQLQCGAGSLALVSVPGGPTSTDSGRYRPALYGGGSWANIISPRYTPDSELAAYELMKYGICGGLDNLTSMQSPSTVTSAAISMSPQPWPASSSTELPR